MRYFVLFLFAFVLWLLLTWPADWQHIIVGVIVSILVMVLFGRLAVVGEVKMFDPKRWAWFIVYLVVFIWECIKANLDVAYRVIHPRMPIKPGIVKVKTNLKSDVARTFLANTITMTPGTLSVDVDGDELYIHWIYVRDETVEGATKYIVGRFERFLAKVFE